MRLLPWILPLTACSAQHLNASSSFAPATVLLAQIDGAGNLSVEGSIVTDAWVDIDAKTREDQRYAFRYVVQDAKGKSLYERSTPGPVIVKDFLAYYGGASNFDILAMLPGLGQFPVEVPLLEGADRVSLQLRDENGDYVEKGGYSLAEVESTDVGLSPLVVDWESLWQSGPSENRVDIVLTGDGYTEGEQEKWKEDAQALADAILNTEPYASYASLINIHRVDVVSTESGVSYDCVGDCRLRDTAYGTVFALEAVNRLLGTSYRTTAVFQLEQWEVARAVSVVPWDQVIVVANTPHTGGFAVHYATVPNAGADWTEVGLHEFGHTMGLLGDEYTGDACIRSASLGLPENITDQAENPPWLPWVDAETPLPTPESREYNDVNGTFVGAWNCPDLYRSRQHCRMNDHTDAYCPVCTELLVRRLLRYADPLDPPSVAQEGSHWQIRFEAPLSEVEVGWFLDGEEVKKGIFWEGALRPGQVLEAQAQLLAPEVRMDTLDLGERWRFEGEK